jgi:hypothetical protein
LGESVNRGVLLEKEISVNIQSGVVVLITVSKPVRGNSIQGRDEIAIVGGMVIQRVFLI